MNQAARFLCLLCVAASSTLPARAAETAKQPPSVLAGVKELDKPVTYTETKIPLGELVQKVSDDTGAPLTASRDVADEPVAVVVKDYPARELLEQLADLLDYRWSRRGVTLANRQPHFEIWQDLASKQREEALREEQRREVEKRFRQELDRYVQMAKLPPEEVKRLADADIKLIQELPTLSREQVEARMRSPEAQEQAQRGFAARKLTSPVQRTLASLLGQLTPQQWETLRDDRPVVFSTAPEAGEEPIPAEMARTLRSAHPSMYLPGSQPTIRDPSQEERMRVQEKQMQDQWAAATGYRITIDMAARQLGSTGSLTMNAGVQPFRTGGSFPPPFVRSTGTELTIIASALDFRAALLEDTPERRAALEKDPVAGAKQLFKPEANPHTLPFGLPGRSTWRLRDLLPDLARTYGVQFLADAYASSAGGGGSDPRLLREPGALYTLLDRYSGSSHRWERRGNLIRLRSRTWFLDRPREIPLRMVRRWKSLYAMHGALPIDEYLGMATTLADAQIDGLIATIQDADLPVGLDEFSSLHSARPVLRLYATLQPAQREALWQKAKIPLAEMNPAQQALFLASIEEAERYRTVPVDARQLAGASLSMGLLPLARVFEQRGDAIVMHSEWLPRARAADPGAAPPPPSGNPGAARAGPSLAAGPAAPRPGAGEAPVPGNPGHALAPAAVPNETRHEVLQFSLMLHYGGEMRTLGTLVIAAPEPSR